MIYLPRLIDTYLYEWSDRPIRKPLLLRGARQVGKSRAVRHLGERFKYYIEINFEENPEYKSIFTPNLDVKRITSQLSILTETPIIDGETLIFLDEIQECQEAILALRFFKEKRPHLHVVATGSLLEFALAEIPTFGVGRIHSLYMYPMTFDEFLIANNASALLAARNSASSDNPLPEIFLNRLVEYFRLYILIGGMPEVVSSWVENSNYNLCEELQNDIISGYMDDFAKYKKKCDPQLLRNILNSVAVQLTQKFTYSAVAGAYKTYDVKKGLDLLKLAGIITPVVRTDANGLPLGSETDFSYCKYLILDPGLTLRILDLAYSNHSETKREILSASAADLVNKGAMAELIAGLELSRYQSPTSRHELYYWTRLEKNSVAEVDYVFNSEGKIIPLEVKANRQGGMKSLWIFMRAKQLCRAVRSSLENFGTFTYEDKEDGGAIREITVCPLYALSQLPRLLSSIP